MAIPRASVFRSALGRTVFRRAGTQSRTQAWRQIGRRQYATEHGKQSSEIPWIIGSVALTVPAAVWLLGQGPSGGHHGEGHHGGEEKKEPEEESAEESKEEQPAEEDSKDDSKKDSKKKDDSKEEKKDDSKEDSGSDSSDDEGDKKDTPQTSDDSDSGDDESDKPSGKKGPGEGGKAADRKPTEKKGEKDAAGDFSGAKHPYLDDPEKSKKLGGTVTDTAKIHGTVDPSKTGATGSKGTAGGTNDDKS